MAVYIHIPFCGSKCTYCAFYSVASPAWIGSYIESLKKEIVFRKDYLNGKINHSLYIGGGTPSILPEQLFADLMDVIYRHLSFSEDSERTIEVNPEDVTKEKAALWHRWGFNRVSLGIQSFNDSVLKQIKRRHSGNQAEEAIRILRKVGFQNISGDLIVGLPGQSMEILRTDVERMCHIMPEHLSVYMLSVDERTELEMQVKRGQFIPLDEEVIIERFEAVCHQLTSYGYEHYEISNFARPGMRARHNSAYWKGLPYLGLGTSAHSYNGKTRHWGISSIKRYIELLHKGKLPLETEELTDGDRYNEKIMTALRLSDGIQDSEMCDLNKEAWNNSEIYRLQCIQAGYATCKNGCFTLTPKGWLISDKIFSELFL